MVSLSSGKLSIELYYHQLKGLFETQEKHLDISEALYRELRPRNIGMLCDIRIEFWTNCGNYFAVTRIWNVLAELKEKHLEDFSNNDTDTEDTR